MPNILTNPLGIGGYSSLDPSTDFGYKYPNEWNLRPGSKLHEKIKTEVLNRARISAISMKNRFDSWNDIDKKTTAYITLDSEEEDVKDVDSRKPVSIVFPYSYTILETLISYMIAAFLQDPMIMYEGVSPEDTLGAILMEKAIDLHCCRSKVGLNLHTMFRDTFCYGVGTVHPFWNIIRGQKLAKRKLSRSIIGALFGKDEYEKVVQDDVVLFEGNALRNVDQYKYLPDPDIPAHEVQKGEFVGWIDESRYINLLDDERNDKNMFNVKYLSLIKGQRSTIYGSDQSARNEKTGKTRTNTSDLQQVDVLYMYMKLVPKEWELTTSEKPEKWLFAIANDNIVIKAMPLGLVHNLFPVCSAVPEFDGYSNSPLARLEIQYGLQELLDWLLNTHVANVRKVVNDTLIVDPYMLNLNDLRTPKNGGIVRLRRPAWGRGVTGSYEQLKVSDITKQNIADAGFVMDLMNRTSATDESVMGVMRRGGPERLTEGEFQGTRAGAVSRLERVARVVGMQAMQDIGYMFAHYLQQFMTQDIYVSTTGRWNDVLRAEYGIAEGSMKVSPMDIVIDYDLKIRDGSIPGGSSAKTWVQLFTSISKTPELASVFDIVRIFKHIARSLGAKDVESFVKKAPVSVKTRPDEEVMSEAKAGNLIPMNLSKFGGGGM